MCNRPAQAGHVRLLRDGRFVGPARRSHFLEALFDLRVVLTRGQFRIGHLNDAISLAIFSGTCLGLCLLAPVAGAIPLELSEPGFTLTLPEGFKEVPGEGNSPETRRLYMRAASDDGCSNVSLTIRST